MNRLAAIKRRYKLAKTLGIDELPAASMLGDIDYLLGLLKSHPASKSPDDDRLVLIRGGSLRRMGYYSKGTWWVFGKVSLHSVDIDNVDTWQELLPEMS